jgi:hypothetical protein
LCGAAFLSEELTRREVLGYLIATIHDRASAAGVKISTFCAFVASATVLAGLLLGCC